MAYNDEPHGFSGDDVARLIAAIDNLKALDPACGSGAFPMGLLHKLVYVLRKIDPDNARWKAAQIARAQVIADPKEQTSAVADIEDAFTNHTDYARKLYIIENCLYGVDIQPIAVQIAKLRCFISLIVDDRVDDAKPNRGIRPLPNLETKFVAANSLIGIERPRTETKPQEQVNLTPKMEKLRDELVDILRMYLKVKNPATQTTWLARGEAAAEELNGAFKNVAGFTPINANWIFTTARSVDDLIEKLPGAKQQQAAAVMFRSSDIEEKEKQLAEVRQRHFATHTTQSKNKWRDRDRELRKQIAELLKKGGWADDSAQKLAAWDPYDQNSAATFFDAEWMFDLSDGFHIVLGNPPYINIKNQEDSLKLYIKEHYQFSKGADIYVAFIENSLRQLETGGTLAFIVPNKFFGADYGKELRRHLQNGSAEIASIWDLKDERIFESALISTIVLIIRNQRTNRYPVLIQGDSSRVVDRLFDRDGKIQIEADNEANIIIDKMNRHKPLETFADVRTGIMGFEYWKMSEIINEGNPSAKNLKLYVNGNFERYTSFWGIKTVNLYKDRFVRPVIKLDGNYLNANTIAFFKATPKIIVRGVSKRLAGTIDMDGSGLLVAVHAVIPKGENWQYYLGLLNSMLLNWYHLNTQYSIRIPEGSLKYPVSFLKSLPIPQSNNELQSRIIKAVDRIIAAKQKDPVTDTSGLERDIDTAVFQLYGLTAEEIKVVNDG